MTTRVPDTISLLTAGKVVTGSTYELLGEGLLNIDSYLSGLTASISVCAYVESGYTLTIRAFDQTNNEELAVLTFTETTKTLKSAVCSNMPVSGKSSIELQAKLDSVDGEGYVMSGILEVV